MDSKQFKVMWSILLGGFFVIFSLLFIVLPANNDDIYSVKYDDYFNIYITNGEALDMEVDDEFTVLTIDQVDIYIMRDDGTGYKLFKRGATLNITQHSGWFFIYD